MSLRLLACLACLLWCLLGLDAGTARAGAATANLTPPLGIEINGRTVPQHVFCRRVIVKPGVIDTNLMGAVGDRVKMNWSSPKPAVDGDFSGPVDPEMFILSVQHADGRPLSLLANHSLHFVGGVGPGHLSADYFGVFCERMKELLGAEKQEPAFVALMSNGTSGDINNNDFRKARTPLKPYEQIRIVAEDVARELHRVTKPLTYRDDLKLSAASTELEMAVRKPSPAEVDRARGIVGGRDRLKLRTWTEFYANKQLILAEYPDRLPMPLPTKPGTAAPVQCRRMRSTRSPKHSCGSWRKLNESVALATSLVPRPSSRPAGRSRQASRSASPTWTLNLFAPVGSRSVGLLSNDSNSLNRYRRTSDTFCSVRAQMKVVNFQPVEYHPTAMKTTLIHDLKSGTPLLGTLVTTSETAMVEVLASCGYDWLLFDLEHGCIHPSSIPQQLLATGGRCHSVVRIPECSPAWFKLALDAGCDGLMVPLINDATEARRAVEFAKYPPLGSRSVGIGRAQGYGATFAEYVRTANESIALIVQIEHIRSVENLEAILDTPGIDGAFIGPYDLSGSLGVLGEVTHPCVLEAIAVVKRRCGERRMPVGIFTLRPEQAAREFDEGCSLVAVGIDTHFLRSAATEALLAVRSKPTQRCS